jgi:ankyrin repeat protein
MKGRRKHYLKQGIHQRNNPITQKELLPATENQNTNNSVIFPSYRHTHLLLGSTLLGMSAFSYYLNASNQGMADEVESNFLKNSTSLITQSVPAIAEIAAHAFTSLPITLGLIQYFSKTNTRLPLPLIGHVVYNLQPVDALPILPEHNFLEAAKKGRLTTLENLGKYVNINAQDNLGNTAAHLAILHISDIIVLESALKILIDLGDSFKTKNFKVLGGIWSSEILPKTPFDLLKENPDFNDLKIRLKDRISKRDAESIRRQEEQDRIDAERISKNASLEEDAKKQQGISELEKAIADGNVIAVREKKEFIIKATPEHHRKWLFESMKKDNLGIIEILLSENIVVNIVDENQNSLLHVAVNHSLITVTTLLKFNKYLPITKNNNLETPYHVAARSGLKEIIAAISDKDTTFSTNIDLRNNDGDTVLMVAMKNNHESLADSLLDKGASVWIVDNDGNYPLFLALEKQYDELAEKMVKRKASTTVVNNRGQDATKIGIQADSSYTIDLIKSSISINHQDKNGWTALVYSIVYNNYRAFTALLEHRDIDFDVVDKEGNSVIHLLIKMNQLESLKKVIEKKANINIVNKFGYSPIDLALMTKNVPITKLLIKNGAYLTHVIPVEIHTVKTIPLYCGFPSLSMNESNAEMAVALVENKHNNRGATCHAYILKQGERHKKYNTLDNVIFSNIKENVDETGLVASNYIYRNSLIQQSLRGIEALKTITMTPIEVLFLSGSEFNEAFSIAIQYNASLKEWRNSYSLTLSNIGNYLLKRKDNQEISSENSLKNYIDDIKKVYFFSEFPKNDVIIERIKTLEPTIKEHFDFIRKAFTQITSSVDAAFYRREGSTAKDLFDNANGIVTGGALTMLTFCYRKCRRKPQMPSESVNPNTSVNPQTPRNSSHIEQEPPLLAVTPPQLDYPNHNVNPDLLGDQQASSSFSPAQAPTPLPLAAANTPPKSKKQGKKKGK